MTIGAVTARSHGGLRPANQNRPPRTAKIIQLRKTRVVKTRIPPSVSTRGLKHAIRNQQTKSLAQIARIVTGNVVRTVARSTPLSLAGLMAAEYIYHKVVEPDGFPGFDNINEGWRDPHSHHTPGDYIGNLFDIGPFGPPPVRALLDADDTIFPTIRYWGDFGVDPYVVPGTVGDNWPTEPQWLPNPVPGASPAGLPVPRYLPQRDLAPKLRRAPRWKPTNNLTITIRLPSLRPFSKGGVDIKHNTPRSRDRPKDDKAKPANQFVYAVLKKLANTMGEAKEWTDILAEAAGYDGVSFTAPQPIQKGHETVKKAWWLFVDGGINNIDFKLLAELVIENEIEDFLIGIAGQMSKSAAQSLGLTVGPQTGLAL